MVKEEVKKEKMNKRVVIIGIGVVLVATLLLLPFPEKKMNEVVEVQLGQPIVIGPAEKEIQLLDRLPYDKANIVEIDIDENQRSILLWQYCVPEISRELRETKDFKEGRIRLFTDSPMYINYVNITEAKSFVTIGYQKCWFEKSDNLTHQLYGSTYHDEGETKSYDSLNLEITWESTQIRKINNESVITIKLSITQV